MSTSFLKEYLLSQLCRLGIDLPCKKQEEEKPVVVRQTLDEAGYCEHIPTDDIPVALIPGMLRLDKRSWLNALSIEATLSPEVEDGDLVYPVSTNASSEFISNIAALRDAVWKPVNAVANTASTSEDSPRIWGIAYRHIGRVMFGPVVFHRRFSFKTGDLLYVGEDGAITTENVGMVLGVCLAPGSIFIDLSVTSSKLALDALEDKIESIKQDNLQITDDLSTLLESIKAMQTTIDSLNDKFDSLDKPSDSIIADGSTTERPLSDRFADITNVKDFGAVGDGVSDDTGAFELAVSKAGKYLVYVPTGIYLVDDVNISRLVGPGIIRWKTGRQLAIDNVAKASHIRQVFWGELGSSYNATIQDASICYDAISDKTYLFLCQQRSGTAYTQDVVHVISQYELPNICKDTLDVLDVESATKNPPIAQVLLTGKLGHGEGISAICDRGQIYLYGQACNQYSDEGVVVRKAAEGFTRITWRGEDTNANDVKTFYGLKDIANAGQVAVSPNGKNLAICYSLDTFSGTSDNQYFWDSASANAIAIYDLDNLVNAGSDIYRESIKPIYTKVFARKKDMVIRSGLAIDDNYIYILTSDADLSGVECLSIYSYNGDLVRNIELGAASDIVPEDFYYGRDVNNRLYFPYQKEVEGLAAYNDSLYMIAKLHFAALPTDSISYCTFLGRTYIAIADNTNTVPTDTAKWAPTKHIFADAQEWNKSQAYKGLASSDTIILHYRYLISLSPLGVYKKDFPIGQTRWFNNVHNVAATRNILTLASKNLSRVVLGTLPTNIGSILPYAELTNNGEFNIYCENDQLANRSLPLKKAGFRYRRSIDSMDYEGPEDIPAFMRVGNIDNREDKAGGIAFFVGDGDNSSFRCLYLVPEQGTVRVYKDLRPALDNTSELGNGNLWWKKLYVREVECKNICIMTDAGSAESPQYVVRPLSDNNVLLGSANRRWANIYSASGTISTSDEREKQDVVTISDELLDAWEAISYKNFIFAEAAKKKGSAARMHSGLIAQQVAKALAEAGIDAAAYGFFCFDKWEASETDSDTISTGNLYGIRYEEALCIEAAYQRRRADRLEARLEALETALQNLTPTSSPKEEPSNV